MKKKSLSEPLLGGQGWLGVDESWWLEKPKSMIRHSIFLELCWFSHNFPPPKPMSTMRFLVSTTAQHRHNSSRSPTQHVRLPRDH